MSDFSSELRAASFRGVAFSVISAELSAGRRTQLHEYPLRDTPYVEDLGRAARRISLTAYIVGPDYVSRVRSLIAAMEASGSGKLIHPWLGEMLVTPESVGKVSFSTQLGVATVTLSFIESGELDNPSSSTDTLQAARESIESCGQAAVAGYERAVVASGAAETPMRIVTAAFIATRSLLSASAFLRDTGLFTAISSIAVETEADIKGLASALLSAVDCSKLAGTACNWRLGASDLSSCSMDEVLDAESTSGMAAGSLDQMAAANGNAVKSLCRAILAIEAAGCATMAGTDDDASGELISYDALIDARDAVCDAIDAAELSTDDDELAIALEDLRSRVYLALTERARGRSRLITLDAPPGEPLVVTAYKRYGDASRADELARLNAVRNIGFAPAGGLKALSE